MTGDPNPIYVNVRLYSVVDWRPKRKKKRHRIFLSNPSEFNKGSPLSWSSSSTPSSFLFYSLLPPPSPPPILFCPLPPSCVPPSCFCLNWIIIQDTSCQKYWIGQRRHFYQTKRTFYWNSRDCLICHHVWGTRRGPGGE